MCSAVHFAIYRNAERESGATSSLALSPPKCSHLVVVAEPTVCPSRSSPARLRPLNGCLSLIISLIRYINFALLLPFSPRSLSLSLSHSDYTTTTWPLLPSPPRIITDICFVVFLQPPAITSTLSSIVAFNFQFNYAIAATALNHFNRSLV